MLPCSPSARHLVRSRSIVEVHLKKVVGDPVEQHHILRVQEREVQDPRERIRDVNAKLFILPIGQLQERFEG